MDVFGKTVWLSGPVGPSHCLLAEWYKISYHGFVKRKYQIYSLVLVLVVMLVCIAWLLLKYFNAGFSKNSLPRKEASTATVEPVSPLKSYRSDRPIQKMVITNNSEVIWEVRGIVKMAFVADGKFLAGSIEVENDRNKAEIPVTLGTADSYVSWGTYTGKLGVSSVTWVQKSLKDATAMLGSGTPVVMRFRWVSVTDERHIQLKKMERLWDGAIDSYSDGIVAVDQNAVEPQYSIEIGVAR